MAEAPIDHKGLLPPFREPVWTMPLPDATPDERQGPSTRLT